MSLVISKAILLALAPMVHQDTFWSNVGFRHADDCPYFNSCSDEPYGDSKWNGNPSNTSILAQQLPMFEESGFMMQSPNSPSTLSVLLGSLTKKTKSSTTPMESMWVGVQTTSSIFVNSRPHHRPSKPQGKPWEDPDFPAGDPCNNPGKGKPKFCNPEPEYPAPIPLPAPIMFLLSAIMGLGVFKMFKNMDDLEGIR